MYVCVCVYLYVYVCIYVSCICVYCYECVCVCTYCGEPSDSPFQESRHTHCQLETDWLQSVHNSGLSSNCPQDRDDAVKVTALASGQSTHSDSSVCVYKVGLFVSIQNNYKELAQLQRFLWYIRWKPCPICIASLTPS